MNDNTARTGPALRIIFVSGPDDMDNFGLTAGRLLRLCRMILTDPGFRVVHNGRASDNVPGKLFREGKRTAPVIILRDAGMPVSHETRNDG